MRCLSPLVEPLRGRFHRPCVRPPPAVTIVSGVSRFQGRMTSFALRWLSFATANVNICRVRLRDIKIDMFKVTADPTQLTVSRERPLTPRGGGEEECHNQRWLGVLPSTWRFLSQNAPTGYRPTRACGRRRHIARAADHLFPAGNTAGNQVCGQSARSPARLWIGQVRA